MYMRITWGKLKPGTWTQYEQAYRQIVAQMQGFPGLIARWLVRDIDDPDAGFAVSIWKDLESLGAYEQSTEMKSLIVPTLSPFYAGEYRSTTCEVRAYEVNDVIG